MMIDISKFKTFNLLIFNNFLQKFREDAKRKKILQQNVKQQQGQRGANVREICVIQRPLFQLL